MSKTVVASSTIENNKTVALPDTEELLLTKLVLGYDNDSDFNDENDDDANRLKATMRMFDEFVDKEIFANGGEDEDGEANLFKEKDNMFGFDIENSDEEEEIDNLDEAVQDDDLFAIENSDDEDENMDDGAAETGYQDSEDEEASESEVSDAWEDSDDEHIKINIYQNKRLRKLKRSYDETDMLGVEYVKRLRTQYEKIYPRPEWIDTKDSSDSENEDDENLSDNDTPENEVNDYNALLKLLKQSNNYTKEANKSSKILPTDKLTIQRLKDANFKQVAKSGIQAISYHPKNSNLILTAGYDKSMRLYHIDNKENNIIQSIFLKGTPIQSCFFYSEPSKDSFKNIAFKQSQNNNLVFAAGRRRYMHKWDLNEINNNSNIGISKISRLQGQEFSQKSFENFKLGHIFESDYKSSLKSFGIIVLIGSNGYINIVNAITGQLYTFLKINGQLVDIAIDYKPSVSNGIDTIIVAINKQGEIYEFNVSKNGNNKVERYWKDPSIFNVTKLSIGGGTMSDSYLQPIKDIVFNIKNGKLYNNLRSNKWLAIGLESGHVSIYDLNKVRSDSKQKNFETNVTPEYHDSFKIIDNVLTSISQLEFSHDGQLLAIASRTNKDCLKLANVLNGKVYSNWPNANTPLGKVTYMKFSNNSEVLATGNHQGKVRLWKIGNYF
ncbi:WD40 repeat-like protein [Hanseniaspora valbyensis NRRL Y-1626]|uniref:WD40 repeat-like protein n=1 Tax=Hanseniaspora valbyensis NRRL Y-1626 TaxID=766949 RepID=A0A1B7T8W1_9ASCO|nr:WD40 repeat-like protein [Hanseniaspora valbyensis NRRL Y-1626]